MTRDQQEAGEGGAEDARPAGGAEVRPENSHDDSQGAEPGKNRSKRPAKGGCSRRGARDPPSSSSDSSGDESDDLSPGPDDYDFSHGFGRDGNVTSSFRQMDTVSSTHEYTISGFELARRLGSGSRICSDYFEVCGQLFRLEVYPAGYAVDVRKYISIFLTTPNTSPSHVLHEISILDQNGKGRHVVRSNRGRTASQSRAIPGIVAAYPRFAKMKDLLASKKRYLPQDRLVLRAKVDIIQSWRSLPMQHPQYPHHHHAQGAYTPSAFVTPQSTPHQPPGNAQGVYGCGIAPPHYPTTLPGATMHYYSSDHMYGNPSHSNEYGSSVPTGGPPQA